MLGYSFNTPPGSLQLYLKFSHRRQVRALSAFFLGMCTALGTFMDFQICRNTSEILKVPCGSLIPHFFLLCVWPSSCFSGLLLQPQEAVMLNTLGIDIPIEVVPKAAEVMRSTANGAFLGCFETGKIETRIWVCEFLRRYKPSLFSLNCWKAAGFHSCVYEAVGFQGYLEALEEWEAG